MEKKPERDEKNRRKIIITGAAGRIGREVTRNLLEREDLDLVGAVGDRSCLGEDIRSLLGLKGEPLYIENHLQRTIERTKAQILLDFTTPEAAKEIIKKGIEHGLSVISGTTGLEDRDLISIKERVEQEKGRLLIAPNFSLGAVLMMKLAHLAAPFFQDVEIVELHHNKKRDAPSGTAKRTATLLSPSIQKSQENLQDQEREREKEKRIKIHSIRLPGLLAHQEVIFGGFNETLTIRHDSYHHSSFMTGILLAIERIHTIEGMMVGLEELIELPSTD